MNGVRLRYSATFTCNAAEVLNDRMSQRMTWMWILCEPWKMLCFHLQVLVLLCAFGES
jgi:hypothetical protein